MVISVPGMLLSSQFRTTRRSITLRGGGGAETTTTTTTTKVKDKPADMATIIANAVSEWKLRRLRKMIADDTKEIVEQQKQ